MRTCAGLTVQLLQTFIFINCAVPMLSLEFGFSVWASAVRILRAAVQIQSERIRLRVLYFFEVNFQLLGKLRREFVNVGGQKQSIGYCCVPWICSDPNTATA
jgi:hypothetical protein